MAEQKMKAGKRAMEEGKEWLEGEREIPTQRETEIERGAERRPMEEAGRREEMTEEYREDRPSAERMGERVRKEKSRE